MAATIAHATGYDKTRIKRVHRLGHDASEASADTWRTFAKVFVRKDGSGYVCIERDGAALHRFEFGPEE